MNVSRLTFFVVVLVVLCKMDNATLERTFLDMYTPILRDARKMLWMLFGRISQDPRNLKLAAGQNRLQQHIDESVPFPCELNDTRSPSRPTSVHLLRPGDIDVIAAMGDSLTAGFGLLATSIAHILLENRGVSFSAGGQWTWREFLTLPNILKEFNSNLIGYSLGDSNTWEWESQFNVAEGGAISANTPYMASVLVKKLRNDPRVNIQRDWKMITLHIGSNDFCSEICYVKDPETILEEHRGDLIRTLRVLKNNLPRTFVNIIETIDLKIITEFTNKPEHCYITHSGECPCLFGLVYKSCQARYFQIIKKWQMVDKEVVSLNEFDSDDFTVVLQPFTHSYIFPTTKDGYTDYSHLSQDCFHLSQKENARVANGLWNNLLEPVGNKSTNAVKLFEKINCPSAEHPFLYTRRNSKKKYP